MLSPIEAIKILEQRGMTQEQIADLLHVKQSYISRVKNGSIACPNYKIADSLRELALFSTKR